MLYHIKQTVTRELYAELKKRETNGIRFELIVDNIEIFLDEYKNIDNICGTSIAYIEYSEGLFKIKSYISHRTESSTSCFDIIIPIDNELRVFAFVNWYKTLLNKRTRKINDGKEELLCDEK